jgi:hypothetical protein
MDMMKSQNDSWIFSTLIFWHLDIHLYTVKLGIPIHLELFLKSETFFRPILVHEKKKSIIIPLSFYRHIPPILYDVSFVLG